VAEAIEVAEALVVRPGDKLLIRVRQDTYPEHADQLAKHLKRRIPEVEVTIIAAEQFAVVRDG
jgi:hypothetical protein